jgi:mono/diheme cytochrome c family protein
MKRYQTTLGLIFSLALGHATVSSAAVSQQISSEHLQFFENKIRPILATHCLECHSADKGKIKGGLNLDSKPDWIKGGESGALIKDGDVRGSTLIKAVTWEDDLQMPPKKKLTDDQIEDLKQWVAMGAPDPREPSKNAAKLDKKAHWAYQQVQRPEPPKVKNPGWCINSIDKFVLAKLEEKSMIPSTAAEKEALLRRAYFDLIGIPPTPRQIEEFTKDQRPEAFAAVVDRLLADPGYGERWGRHWLDTARYSDTTGAAGNELRGEDYRYSYAWAYREWVIKAINADMPYDQFILNQIAADKVPNNAKENLAGLGFLTVGQRFKTKDDVINDRIDVVGRGMLGLTLACARCHDHKFDPVTAADYYALRGIFESCTEPKEGPLISGDPNSPAFIQFNQKVADLEKKSIEAYFGIIREVGDKVRKNADGIFEYMMLTSKAVNPEPTPEQLKRSVEITTKLRMDDQEIKDAVGKVFRENNKFMGPFIKLGRLEKLSDKPEGRNAIVKIMLEGKTKDKASPKVLAFLAAAQQKGPLPSDITGAASLFAKFMADFEPKVPSLFATLADPTKDAKNSADKENYELATFPFNLVQASEVNEERIRQDVRNWGLRLGGRLQGRSSLDEINQLKLTFKGGPVRAMALEDLPKPKDSPLFVRGNAPKAGEEVKIIPRRFIDVLSEGGQSAPFGKDESGRYSLAKAIASKSNPLTARVMVNRIWMYHFGEGLVRTPDDLGNQAGAPSHPELLDFLSAWFMEDMGPAKPAWSVKALHKAIMLSRAYQQSSNSVMKGAGAMDYEKMDPSNSLIWRSNVRRLDFESFRDSLLSMAGILDRNSVGGPSFNVTDEPFIPRRAVYAYIDRAAMPDLLMQFDMANPDQPNTKRTSTIVPQQALFLMNSAFAASVVQNIVKRPEVVNAVAVEKNTDKGITAVFRIVLQRTPSPLERKLAMDFLINENRKQESVKAQTAQITKDAAKMAQDKVRRAQNTNNGRNAIANEGEAVQRVTFSPWETLVQALLFSNEAAYVN